MMSRSFRWIGMGLFLCAGSAEAVTLDRLEASVNSSLILASDISRFRETLPLRQQLDPLFTGTPLAAKGKDAPAAEIVQFLADERLILQQFPTTDADVEQSINEIQSTNKIERKALREALKEQGFSFDDYFELIRGSVAKRNLIDRDIRTKVTITDDDVKNYFYNHYTRKAGTALAYRVRILTVTPANYKSAAAARDVIERALKDIRAGEAFEEVAKRVSDDSTAQSGGELGKLTDDQMSPAIREQLKKLQIGKTSDVLGDAKTRFYVLQLVDVSSGEDDRLARMKEEIRAQLAAAEYQHQIQLWLERQRQTAFIHKAGAPPIAGLPAR